MIRCKEAKISQVINNSLRPVTPPALKNKVKVMAPKTESKPVGIILTYNRSVITFDEDDINNYIQMKEITNILLRKV